LNSALNGALLIVGITGRIFVPRNLRIRKNEDQEFAQVPEDPSPRKPPGSSQGPRLHHQQAEPALQGTPGLMLAAGRACSAARLGGCAKIVPLGDCTFPEAGAIRGKLEHGGLLADFPKLI
jgi:hypothetical protein